MGVTPGNGGEGIIMALRSPRPYTMIIRENYIKKFILYYVLNGVGGANCKLGYV